MGRLFLSDPRQCEFRKFWRPSFRKFWRASLTVQQLETEGPACTRKRGADLFVKPGSSVLHLRSFSRERLNIITSKHNSNLIDDGCGHSDKPRSPARLFVGHAQFR